MNSVLDVLKLRHVRLNYQSPAICPPVSSGSGSSIFLMDIEGPAAPTGLRFGGQCNKFLTWTNYPDLICMSLYRSEDPGDITGPYVLLKECLAHLTAYVCSPGWWKIALLDSRGNEILQSEPVSCLGDDPLQIPLPSAPGAVTFTLHQNLDLTNPGAPYAPVFTNSLSSVFEVCAGGCYALQAITLNGVSPLSAPVCRAALNDIADCVGNFVWDPETCDCYCDETPCQQGYHFDLTRCECWCDEQVCTGYFRWDEATCACVCDDRACPEFQHLDVATCECELDGCDESATYPTVASWDAEVKSYAALDRTRQILWIPNSKNDVNPPHQHVGLVDTANAVFLGYADTDGLITTGPMGDTSNGMGQAVMDTKYSTCVVIGNQGWVTWYDLATQKAVDISQESPNFTVTYWPEPPYDAQEGLIYTTMQNAAFPVAVRVMSCNPATRGTLGIYSGAGYNSGECAFASNTRTLYIVNTNGGNLFHKWDVDTHVYTYNQGPALAATSVRFIREINLLLFLVGTTGYWVDPTTDQVVGSTNLIGSVSIRCADYNDCTGKIYVNTNTASQKIKVIDPLAGFSLTTIATAGLDYTTFKFDQLSNRLFSVRAVAGYPVETYV